MKQKQNVTTLLQYNETKLVLSTSACLLSAAVLSFLLTLDAFCMYGVQVADLRDDVTIIRNRIWRYFVNDKKATIALITNKQMDTQSSAVRNNKCQHCCTVVKKLELHPV